MKSSSKLFPVSLLSAEFKAGLYEDVYLLKPNNSADRSVAIALIRLNAVQNCSAKPVLLVHDAFHNHWQWLDYELKGIAGDLAREGLDVWLMDWRGHGLSTRNERPHKNTLNEMASFDLPAIVDFIEEKSQQHPAIIARGLACEMVSLALADDLPMPEGVFIDSARLSPNPYYWLPGIKMLRQLSYAHRPWIKKKHHEEPESRQLFLQQLSKEGWLGQWRSAEGISIKKTLQQQSALRWVFASPKAPWWFRRLKIAEHLRVTRCHSPYRWSELLPSTWSSR